MNLPKFANLDLLYSIFPGLVTYLIVHRLCSRERKLDSIDTILVSLAYTICIHSVWFLMKAGGSLIPTPDIVGLSLVSVGFGLLVSFFVNNGLFWNTLRTLRITDQPAWESIWKTAFKKAQDEQDDLSGWVVIELVDSRRIMGCLVGYSANPENGVICIDDPRWLVSDGVSEIGGRFLLECSNISNIHFLSKTDQSNDRRETQQLEASASKPSGTETATTSPAAASSTAKKIGSNHDV